MSYVTKVDKPMLLLTGYSYNNYCHVIKIRFIARKEPTEGITNPIHIVNSGGL